MTRDKYLIEYEGNSLVKNAWNSANRAIEAIVRKIAREEHTIYRLKDRQSVKNGFDFVKGCRVWAGDNGRIIHFYITKLPKEV